MESYILSNSARRIAQARVSLGATPWSQTRIDWMDVASSVESQGALEGASLDQNYPNPFSSATRIDFELTDSRNVRLRVFDALGRTVVVLIDGVLPAGSHVAYFDASALPTGAYWYRLEADGIVATRQMTLVRR